MADEPTVETTSPIEEGIPLEDQAMSIGQILGLRNFRFLWLGQIVSNFGDALTPLTLVLLINRVTGGSTTAIATLLIALALPQAVIGLSEAHRHLR